MLRAILSRVLVVLALVLFGTPQSLADEKVAHAGPAAESHLQQAVGILTVQRHLLRAPFFDDTLQDLTMPGAIVQVRQPLCTAMAPASLPPHVQFAIFILRTVRGPPVL